ncbi:MAG: hypothetical protein NTX64_19120 [Elusimicrobia bacterium]|nr:hypothetical protein [Elusimicrobiota bacterium]
MFSLSQAGFGQVVQTPNIAAVPTLSGAAGAVSAMPVTTISPMPAITAVLRMQTLPGAVSPLPAIFVTAVEARTETTLVAARERTVFLAVRNGEGSPVRHGRAGGVQASAVKLAEARERLINGPADGHKPVLDSLFDGGRPQDPVVEMPAERGIPPIEAGLRAYFNRKDTLLRAAFEKDNVGGDRSKADVFVYAEDHSDKALIGHNMDRLYEDIKPGRGAILLIEGYSAAAPMGMLEKIAYLKKKGLDTKGLMDKGVSLKDGIEVRGWDDAAALEKGGAMVREYVGDLAVLKRLAGLQTGRVQKYTNLLRQASKTMKQWLAARNVVITQRNKSLDASLEKALADARATGRSVHVIAGSQHLFERPLMSEVPLAGGMRLRKSLKKELSGGRYVVEKPAYTGEAPTWGEKIDAMQRHFLGWDSLDASAAEDAAAGYLPKELAQDAAALRKAYEERGAELADDTVEAFHAGAAAEEAVYDAARAAALSLLASADEATKRRLAAVLDVEFTSIIGNRNAAKSFAKLGEYDPTQGGEAYERFSRIIAESRFFDGLASRAHAARNALVFRMRDEDPVFKAFSERLSEIIKGMSMDGSGTGPKRENWVRKNAMFGAALFLARPYLQGHPLRFIEPRGASVRAALADETPLERNADLAKDAVREVRRMRLHSSSALDMQIASIQPGSRAAKHLPRLKELRDKVLADLIAVREEFDKEFGIGKNPSTEHLAQKLKELVAKYRAANCNEQAFLAQAYLRGLGIRADLVAFETMDWWTKQKMPSANHVFVVLGLAPGANPAVPSTWGPDAVIADPWGNVAGPAQASLDTILNDIFKLDRTHQIPSFVKVNYEDLYDWARASHGAGKQHLAAYL